MKKYFVLLVSIIIGMSHISAQTNNGLVFWLSGNKSLKDASGQNVKIQETLCTERLTLLAMKGRLTSLIILRKTPRIF